MSGTLLIAPRPCDLCRERPGVQPADLSGTPVVVCPACHEAVWWDQVAQDEREEAR